MLTLRLQQGMLTAEQWDLLNKFMDSLPYDPREKPAPAPREWTVEEILAREG